MRKKHFKAVNIGKSEIKIFILLFKTEIDIKRKLLTSDTLLFNAEEQTQLLGQRFQRNLLCKPVMTLKQSACIIYLKKPYNQLSYICQK